MCYRFGVDKSRIGVIGNVCIISGSIDVDGLAMLLVSNGESSFYVLRGGIPFWRTASETCRVEKINQINRISCISLLFYKN